MLPVYEDRHQDRMIRGVRVAVVGIVVEIGVAGSGLRMMPAHRARQQPGAEDVDGQPLGAGQKLVIPRDDRAREVACQPDHRRASRPQQRVLHLAHDPVETVRDHREIDGIEAKRGLDSIIRSILPSVDRALCHASAPISIR